VTSPAIAPAVSQQDTDDLNHIVCCDDDLALCGTDVSAAHWSEDETDCLVCLDLELAPCSGCSP
jgi:hypothetical protein